VHAITHAAGARASLPWPTTNLSADGRAGVPQFFDNSSFNVPRLAARRRTGMTTSELSREILCEISSEMAAKKMALRGGNSTSRNGPSVRGRARARDSLGPSPCQPGMSTSAPSASTTTSSSSRGPSTELTEISREISLRNAIYLYFAQYFAYEIGFCDFATKSRTLYMALASRLGQGALESSQRDLATRPPGACCMGCGAIRKL
jgi:hypothetical protein